jgi:hypothetical protein
VLQQAIEVEPPRAAHFFCSPSVNLLALTAFQVSFNALTLLGLPMAYENLMVFTGNANPALAEGVAKSLGIPLGKAVVS